MTSYNEDEIEEIKRTWRAELDIAMMSINDPGPVIAMAPDEAAFDRPFGGRFGWDGLPVLAWTMERVYFPVRYEGDWLGSAPRNPVAEGQQHVGGG